MTEEPIKVVLFAADCGGYDIERSMEELAALAQANGMEAVAEVVQKRETPEAATFLGEGRLAEGRMLCINLGAECAVFGSRVVRQPDPKSGGAAGGAGHRPHHADFGDIRKPGRDE